MSLNFKMIMGTEWEVPEAMHNKQQSTFTKVFKLLAGNRILITAAFICAAITSISSVFTTFYVGQSIDNIIGTRNVNYNGLASSLFVLAALFICLSVFQWLVSVLANKIAYKTAMDLRIKLFKKLNRLPVSYFDTHPHGDIVSRFTNDLDNVSDALSLTITNLFTGIITVISALVIMFRLSINITAVILIATPFCFIVAYFVSKFSRNTFKRQQAIVGELSAFVSEIVGNERAVKAFGYEEKSIERFKEMNDRLFKAGKNAHFASAIVNPVTRFVDHISYTFVGVVGGIAAITAGISIGTISSFLIYSSQFAKPFNEISSIMSNIQTGFASLDRIFITLAEEEEFEDVINGKALTGIRGEIKFNDVDFSYHIERPLIENLNIHAKPGSLVAIVGPTGAGKTTIVNLLMRFYDIRGGSITIDGLNIKDIKRDDLRKGFGMVLQDTWLFDGTIRENMMYGNSRADENDLMIASKNAHAHSFIKNLYDGYETRVTGDGDNLSQGQKQLITIARVMLANPSMLILDEATSSIDTLTEIRVQKAFQALMRGRTSFVIAHRLSTIASADLILVLNNGQIVETGTHQQLLKAKGFYSELYESQFE